MARLLNCGFEAGTFDIFDYLGGSQSAGFTNATAHDMSLLAYGAGFYTNGFELRDSSGTPVTVTELYGGGRWKTNGVGGAGQAAIYQWQGENFGQQGVLSIQNNVYFNFSNGTTSWNSARSMSYNVWYWLEWHYVLSDTVGVFQLKVNGELWLDLSNIDTKQSTDSYLRWFLVQGVGTGNYAPVHDDIVVNDTTGSGPLTNRQWPNEVAIALLPLSADTAVADWTGSGMTGSPGTYATEVGNDTPKLYLKLDETSGSSAADSSGNSHNGTYGSSVLLAQPPIGKGSTYSANFPNDANAYVDVANHADLNPTAALTLEAWVKGLWQSSLNGSDRMILRKSGQYRLYYNTSGMNFAVTISAAEKVLTVAQTDTAEPFTYDLRADNGWHHIVGTYDGTTMCLYIDGQLLGSQGQTGAIDTTTNVFRVARNSGTNSFFGYIDEVAVYSSALSATRVQTHHKAGKNQYELLDDNDYLTTNQNQTLTGNSDLEYVYASATAKKALYTAGDVDGRFPLVQSVTVWVGARKDTASTAVTIAPLIKRAGTEAAGAATAVTLSERVYRHTYDRDTTDTTDWTPTKANNADYGFKTV